MKWVAVDKKYYFLQDAAEAQAQAAAEAVLGSGDTGNEERAWALESARAQYVRTWLASHEAEEAESGSAALDPRRVEFTEAEAVEAAGRILDGWCRLLNGRAYEVTYRTPGVIYLITPRLRMSIPARYVSRIVVEAGNESPMVLIDTTVAVMMLGLDAAEISILPGDPEISP